MINKVLNKQFLHTLSTIRCATTTNSLRTLCTTFARLQTPPPILDFNNEKYQKYLESLRLEFYDLRNNAGGDEKAYARINQLNGVVTALEQYRVVKGNLASKEDLDNEKDEDMRQLIKEENEIYGEILVKTEEEIMKQMLNLTDDLQYPSIIFEINAGAGGQEAMLFAKDLFEMYTNFFELHSWEYEILEEDKTDIGGLRHANIIVQEQKAYHILQHEAGVHRVQRVPATEKSGRMHTSTASVAVIPRPANVNVTISEKDLKIETKRASGAGGQHVNTTDSAVRVVHLPTGLAVECQAERSQIKNRETAIKRLQAKLLQRQLQSDEASTQATRKSQQGNLNRNEKIRTYNFVQDRITDHRLQNGTVHNLREFIAGGEPLRNLIQRLVIENRKRKLEQILEDWHKQNDDVKTKSESKSKAKN